MWTSGLYTYMWIRCASFGRKTCSGSGDARFYSILCTSSLPPPRHLFLPHTDGADPEYQADDKYPPWLFKLLDERPMLEDFIMKGLEKVPREEMKMVFRLANKRRIKEANDAKRKV